MSTHDDVKRDGNHGNQEKERRQPQYNNTCDKAELTQYLLKRRLDDCKRYLEQNQVILSEEVIQDGEVFSVMLDNLKAAGDQVTINNLII